MKFVDITEKVVVAACDTWCTAATVVDINRDGWKEGNVYRSFHKCPGKRANIIFVNISKGSFTDEVKE